MVKRTDNLEDKSKTYHMVITRQGNIIHWTMEGKPMLELVDPAPLSGKGHDRFGFLELGERHLLPTT